MSKLLVYVFTICFKCCLTIDYPKLQLLSVVFRHGDRELNEDINGDLTNIGRQRAYQLGESLRDKYREFLSSDSRRCVARSTEYARAKMSLQLVLAALYPPGKSHQRWYAKLNWQPVSFAYSPQNDDVFLFPKHCPRFKREREMAETSPEVKKLLRPYQKMLKELNILTGTKMNNSYDMFLLYHKLSAMQSMNLSLPIWANDIFPNGILLNGTYLEYDVLKFTDYMRKINGGALVWKIIDDMTKKSKTNHKDVSTSSKEKEIYLHSSHELIIVSVLQTLKIWSPHIPNYTSSVVIELRKNVNDVFYVKILYYKGIPANFEEVRIPGCSTLCPLEKFIELVSDQLPSRNEIICDKDVVIF